MDDNLVGYLLNALEPETQREVESYVKANPEAEKKLDALRRALEPLAADKDGDEPPAGLAFRAIAQVAEYRCRPLPQAPEPPPAQLAPVGRRWFRRPDVLIAASLLIIVGGITFPAFSHLRQKHDREACRNNLHLFHQALSTYADKHGDDFPTTGDAPHNVAGMFVPTLAEAQCLPEGVSLRCPSNGEARAPSYSLADLKAMSEEDFNKVAPRLAGCYTYPLGYNDVATGQHCGVRRAREELNSSYLPIMSDRPFVGEGDTRDSSPNHRGQNVLFVGGNCNFFRTPNAGIPGEDSVRDHIFLNKNGKVAAGVDRWDTVLGCSEDRP